MLNTDCRDFRETFSPQDATDATDATDHRRHCAACDAYARRLQDAATPVPSPLSARLSRRLAAIPSLAASCDDIDRLYAEARRQARPMDTSPDTDPQAADDHLADCPRCRQLYGCLSEAMTPRPEPLPHGLFQRLQEIGRQAPARLPVWISDTRYATAACYLLTAFLVVLAGDSSARFQATTEVVSARAGTWIERNLDDTSSSLQTMVETLQSDLDGGRQWTLTQGRWLLSQGQDLRQSLTEQTHQLHSTYKNLDLDPRRWFGEEISQPEGEPNGRSETARP